MYDLAVFEGTNCQLLSEYQAPIFPTLRPVLMGAASTRTREGKTVGEALLSYPLYLAVSDLFMVVIYDFYRYWLRRVMRQRSTP